MTDISILATLSNQSYSSTQSLGYTPPSGQTGPTYNYFDHVTDISLTNNLNATGFGAHSFYSSQDKSLVIAYAGTNLEFETIETALDVWADAQLLITGLTVQNSQAISFANQQIAAAREEYGNDISITFTGHSLGGYLAQYVIQEIGEGSSVAFNSPGVGESFLVSDQVNNNVTYVYSDPFAWWGVASAIHNLGDILSDNVFFVLGAEGHTIQSIISAFELGQVPLSAEQWGAILAEGLRIGELTIEDIAPFIGSNDIVHNTVLQAMRDSGTECFLAGTSITLSNGTTKSIEDIRPDDQVMSFDANGTLVASRVTKTFQNHAKHILDVHTLMVTPGHVTLCGDGEFSGRHVPIIDILRSDGALVREDGSKLRAATNCDLGALGDRLVHAITGDRNADGTVLVRDSGEIRYGTRFIMADGRDVSVAELVEAAGGILTDDGLIATADAPDGTPFLWPFANHLPKPEEYVLQRSALHLNDVYQAGEWEAVPPQMPVPVYGEAGPVVSDHPAIRDALPPNIPLSMQGQDNGPTMNRKQRRAYDAKMRKLQ